MRSYNGSLYVCGSFSSIGGIQSRYIAKWDESNWTGFNSSNLDSTPGWNFADLIFYKRELYIGGNFIGAGVESIARWDGSKWVAVGNGISGSLAWVNTMTIYNDELIVGGLFSKDVSNNPGDNIAIWDSLGWKDMGGGMGQINPQVKDLLVFGGELYAVGVFQTAGGIPAQYIAKWNGLEWCGLGSEFENGILAIAVFQDEIYHMYLGHTQYVNNWDLVDSSAHHIVGAYIKDRDKSILYDLAKSNSLWERRIAVISTFYFIKRNQFSETLRISEQLVGDKEDLIHKAVGWMLREVGKRDLAEEVTFLKSHYQKMPRTMLRYAIERFSNKERKKYLNGEI